MTKFTHLHTHSHYSLLDGLAKIDGLIARAKELGMDSLALTDHGNLYGAIEFYKKAKADGIKPIIGIEAYVIPEGSPSTGSGSNKEKYYHLVLLCKNEIGWKNLLKLATHAHLEGFYYKPRISKNFLRRHSEGLIALSACPSGEINRAILNNRFSEAERLALDYQEIFGKGNFYLEIGCHPGIRDAVKAGEGAVALSKKTGIPLVATQDIHYLKKEDVEYHEILLAVQTGNKLDDPDRLSLKDDDFSMRSPEEMAELFRELPEAIENTQKIAEQCNLTIELGKIQLPKFPLPAEVCLLRRSSFGCEGRATKAGLPTEALAKAGVPIKTATDYLRELISERIGQRYSEITPQVKERVDYELGVIEKTGFADYFLIVQDLVNWAKERGIVVGPGRGSAAGSIISYILRITDIDPLKYDLLFERFLNPDRIQMPDIDIDITDRRRDEVMGYLTQKYGEDHVAHIITFGTMAARAAVRDVGRALGVSYGFCDTLAKLIPFNQVLKEALKIPELANMYQTSPDAKRILDAAKHLEGVARHASMHACGIVISEKPLTEHLPLQKAPQDPNTIVTQFEMHSVEDLGLLKMDLLGLKNLTIIEDTVRLVEEMRNEKLEMSKIPLNDEKTFQLLQAGDSTGVFQLESSGMRRYLRELKPTELEDIIAMISLYRPGPMELIPEYIDRKYGRKPIQYLHPKLEPVFKNTYGIMIYQEQLMSAARLLAGFTLAEADVLRKAVGKKIRKLLLEQKEKLIRGCVNNGVSQNIAERFWELIEPFDRYGFNRSHGACYATVAYQTAYLKAHHPVEFMTSLLNADSGDIDRIAFLVSEAQKMSIAVLAPDVNKSSAMFAPDLPAEASAKAGGNNIRFGLTAIKNVGAAIIEAIIAERQKGGPFKNLADLLNRVHHKDLNKKSLESLAKSGALDPLGFERNLILQNIDDIIKFHQALRRAKETSQMGLFAAAYSNNSLKIKPAPPAPPAEKLAWERELLGLYVSDHPLNGFRPKIENAKAKPINELLISGAPGAANGHCNIAGIVSRIQKIITKLGQPMLFAKVEDFTNTMEVVVFSDIFQKTAAIWQENKPVLITGRMSWRNGEPKFICDNAELL